MFCPKCGNQLPAGSRFCNRCGNDLQVQQTTGHIPSISVAPQVPGIPVPPQVPRVPVVPVAPVPTPQPVYVPVAPVPVLKPVRSIPTEPTAFTRALTKSGASILLLITAIVFLFQSLFSYYDVITSFNIVHLNVPPARIIIQIYHMFDLLPILLTIIGLFVVFGSCHSRSAQISGGGFRCLKAAAILRIVFTAILFVIFSTAFFITIFDTGMEYSMLIQMSVLAVLFVFYFIFQGFILSALSSAIEIGRWGKPTHHASFFLALLCFAITVGGVALHFFVPQNFRPFGTTQVILSCVTHILFGIVLLCYRARVNRAMTE